MNTSLRVSGDHLSSRSKCAFLSWIKKARRLLYTFGWTNVGRRYHVARALYDTDRFRVDAIPSKLLGGGFDYETAFRELEDVDIFGKFMIPEGRCVDREDRKAHGRQGLHRGRVGSDREIRSL